MVLLDDEFSTIVAAVEQGRAIFANIRKFVTYLVSCNTSEILVVSIGALLPGPLPVLPLQILFLNLVTDVFPALALGACEGDPRAMRRPPRDSRAPMLARRDWLAIGLFGAVIAAAVLGALGCADALLELGPARSTTIAFATLALAQLWHVFSMRAPGSPFVANEVVRNPWVWGAIALCVALIVAAIHCGPLALVLGTVPLETRDWLSALAWSLLPAAFGQLALTVRARRGKRTSAARRTSLGDRRAGSSNARSEA